MFPERTLKTNNSPQTAALKNTMKINLAKRKFPRGFMRQIRGKNTRQGFVLALSRLRKTKLDHENILRWEDDGGQVIGRDNQIVQVINTAHLDTPNEKLEKQAYQACKDEYLVNDSLGG